MNFHKTNNFVNKTMTIRNFLTTAIIALVCIAVGIFLLLNLTGVINQYKGWEQIVAIISNVDRGVSKTYVDYTYNSTPYTNILLNEYSVSHQVGQSIDILVNPKTPTDITSATVSSKVIQWVLCIIILAVGVGLVVGPAIKFFVRRNTVKKVSSGVYEPGHLDWEQDPYIGNDIPAFDETKCNSYRFLTNGARRSKYTLADESGNVFYTAQKSGYKLFRGRVFTFTNSLSGKTEQHVMGDSLSQPASYANANHFTSVYFNLDYIKVWDYLDHKGLAINYGAENTYTVSLYHREIGSITRGRPEKQHTVFGHAIPNPVGPAVFDIKCTEEYVDHLFLCAVIIGFGMFDSGIQGTF